MRAHKKQDATAGETAGVPERRAREWQRLCDQAALEAGAAQAGLVFFHSDLSGVSGTIGVLPAAWPDHQYFQLWQQQRFFQPFPDPGPQSETTCWYQAVLVERETLNGLLLLQYASRPEPVDDRRRGALELLASHAALLWREQATERKPRPHAENATARLLIRLKALFHQVPVLINGFNRQGQCILWNQECERVFGWHFDELKQHEAPINLFYPEPEERAKVIDTFRAFNSSEFREWHPIDRAGRRLTTLWANIMLPNGDMLCVGHDITVQKQLENQQRLAASVFEASYDGIMLTDADNRVIHVNPAFSRITGYPPEDIVGRPFGRIFRSREEDGELPLFGQHNRDQWQGERGIRCRDGSECDLLLAISVIRNDEGKVLHHAIILSDITHIKQHEEELRQRALYDPLTHIPNRELFGELLERAMAAAERTGTLLAVCYLDLDGFKRVNDTLGHADGDRLLVEMGRRMEVVIRSCDVVARLGGDEFALMITGLHRGPECTEILDRVLAAIELPLLLDGYHAQVSASIGVAVYPEDAADSKTLLRYADKAMYQAKKQGKRRYVFFEHALHQQEHERRRSYQELRQALARGEFLLHFQPRIDLGSRRMVGLEALLRWQHPERGVLKPSDFLPVVLDSDMEFELGLWVIRQVLQQLSLWNEQDKHYRISFNVSAGQLRHDAFCTELEKLLALYPAVSPEQLELEFQESAVRDEVQQVAEVLSRCRELGLTISLDNFGAGHASLVHLNRLPIDIIKIDRRFITDLLSSPEDVSMVEGVVQLASAMSMMVVAEGMEQPALAARLKQLGCHSVQGYGISHPMPADAIGEWLCEWERAQSPPGPAS